MGLNNVHLRRIYGSWVILNRPVLWQGVDVWVGDRKHSFNLPSWSSTHLEERVERKLSPLAAKVQAKKSLYPQVIDPRTGRFIPLPYAEKITPIAERVVWDSKMDRYKFIKEWIEKGYSTPEGGWELYDIHHILPREYGGGNDFWNLYRLSEKLIKIYLINFGINLEDYEKHK